jgi:hypothetical protein
MTNRGLCSLSWVSVIAFISSFGPLAAGAPPDPRQQSTSGKTSGASEALIDALEKPVLASRPLIRAGRLELDSRYITNKIQSVYEKFTTHYTVYFDGTKLRMDSEARFPDHTVLERRISSDNQLIVADCLSPGHPLPAILITEATEQKAAESGLFHPALVGLRARSISEIGHIGIRNPLEPGDMVDASVTDVKFEGRPAKQITYGAGSGHRIQVKIWVSADGKNAVLGIRIESRVGSPPTPHVWEIVSEPKLWPPQDIWYPSRVTYRFYDAGSLIQEEVATIDALVYDQPPSDAIFTLAGLEPEQGREIVLNGTELMAWDHGKLAPLRAGALPEPVGAATPGRQPFKWLLVGNGVFLIGVAAFLIFRFLRKRGTL